MLLFSYYFFNAVPHLGYFGTADNIDLNISKLKGVNLYLSISVFGFPNFRDFY